MLPAWFDMGDLQCGAAPLRKARHGTSLAVLKTMRTCLNLVLACGLGLLFTWLPQSRAAGPMGERAPNTTLALPPTPPEFGYSLAPAWSGLTFNQPVCIQSPPGETNRLFILEKGGTIVVITNLARPTRTVFMTLAVRTDSECGLLGIAFHPGYATNRYFYLFSSRALTTTQGNGLHQRVSRFETSPDDPNVGLPNTEVPLITQYDTAGNHNGGELLFGPDGYLYISVGDEGPQQDGARNSQLINKHFFSAILRIDVDKRLGNLLPNAHPARTGTTNYFIPSDNPYVGATNFNGTVVNPTSVRTEFYAVGFRNPWRMTFDSLTGQLYVADVGQDMWEEVDIVVKGGNYGWVYREGLHAGFRNPPPSAFRAIDPIHEYQHGTGPTRGNSISGGIVYRGHRLSQLHGAYVFGDYTSGNIWMLRANGTNVVPSQRIAGGSGIVAFGADPRNGDVLIAQYNGQILRLNYTANSTGTPLPALLDQTGAFSDLVNLTPHAGIVPYDINVPFWSDGAIKRRWFSVPNLNDSFGFSRDGNWNLPPGSVWVKHFELELIKGVPESRRRLETRFIVRNSTHVYGVTYRWDADQKNAILVPEQGRDESFLIQEGANTREQVWHYPGRAECLNCHTPAAGGVLGFNTAQLNREHDYSGVMANQISALTLAGYLSPPVQTPHLLPSLVSATTQAASLESRVRSYLAANCASCHLPGGPAATAFDARSSTPTALAGLINGALNNNLGDPENRVVRAGSLDRSMLLQRIATRGPRQMPPLSTTVVDTQAVQLISDWIAQETPSFRTFAEWQAEHFTDPQAENAAAGADPDEDLSSNYLEFLVGTNPAEVSPPFALNVERAGNVLRLRFTQPARRGCEVQTTADLANPDSWAPLDLPNNSPFFPAAPFESVMEDAIVDGPPKYYRVRLFER